MEEDNQATSHKGERIRSQPSQFKLDAVSFAQIHGNRAAEWNFTVDRKRIQEWEGGETIEKTVKNKKLKGS